MQRFFLFEEPAGNVVRLDSSRLAQHRGLPVLGCNEIVLHAFA